MSSQIPLATRHDSAALAAFGKENGRVSFFLGRWHTPATLDGSEKSQVRFVTLLYRRNAAFNAGALASARCTRRVSPSRAVRSSPSSRTRSRCSSTAAWSCATRWAAAARSWSSFCVAAATRCRSPPRAADVRPSVATLSFASSTRSASSSSLLSQRCANNRWASEIRAINASSSWVERDVTLGRAGKCEESRSRVGLAII